MAGLAQVSVWLGVVALGSGVAGALAQSMNDRPPLEWHQGRNYRWAAPADWQGAETPNGVSLTAPDGVTAASSVVAMAWPGQTTPDAFMIRVLQMIPGYANVRLLGGQALPPQPSGPMRQPWQIAEMEFSYGYKGVPMRGTWTVGISGLYGMSYDAITVGYQAPANVFDQARYWLAPVASSIAITNLRGVAGNDQIIPPRNRPLDNSALLKVWREKGLSEDRISKARREATMGYERLKDAQTGRIYQMPLERYDGTVGGYRNPVRPNELLLRTQPGE